MNNKKYTAADYAEAAVVAREAGMNAIMRLDLVALKPRTILDMSHEVSFCAPLLRERYPDALITTETYPITSPLPILSNSVDLIVANLFLPWVSDIKQWLSEWRRILRPEGLLVVTSLGPDTLQELNARIHRLPQCIDMHLLGDELIEAGFIDPVLDTQHLTLKYRESKQLFHELNVTQMIDSSTIHNEPLPLLVTYEIIYSHAWGPSTSTAYQADDEGIVRIPLADFLARKS